MKGALAGGRRTWGTPQGVLNKMTWVPNISWGTDWSRGRWEGGMERKRGSAPYTLGSQ